MSLSAPFIRRPVGTTLLTAAVALARSLGFLSLPVSPLPHARLPGDIYDKSRMYDAASSIVAQKLSEVKGVGQVSVGGGALPAVRVDVNPAAINVLGLGLEDVRTMLGTANTNRPKGSLSNDDT